MNKWIIAVVTYLALNCITFGQTPFYSYSYGTMNLYDTLRVKSIEFSIQIEDLERFEEEWIDGLEDLAEDIEEGQHAIYATSLEIPAGSDIFYDAYSMFVDLHDSALIQIAFHDSAGFVERNRRAEFSSLERAAKLYITRIYKEYRTEDLENSEEKLEEAEEKVEEIQEEIFSKEKRIMEKGQKIEANNNSISINRQSLSALVDQIGQKRQSIARLSMEEVSKREEIEGEIEGLEDQRGDHEDEIRELSEDNFDLEKDIADLNFEISAEKQKLQAALVELEYARSAFNELNTEVSNYRVN